MKGYIAALGLSLLFGVAGAASATTAVIDFNNTKNSANATLVTTGPNGAVTMTNVGGRNAVMTGGTSANEFLYVALPKGLFKGAKAVWAVVEYYDQASGTFEVHYDVNGTDTAVQSYGSPAVITNHGTKAWTTYSSVLAGADLEEKGPGGADIWIDDQAAGPEIIDKIEVTDEDPALIHFPHVDPAHLIKPGAFNDQSAWDGAYTVTLNMASQDAVAGGANYPGPDKFSGVYDYKWDESGLYVRGNVIDATPRMNDQTGDKAWDGDGIEEFLALDWSDPTHTTYLPGTDFHVFIGLGDPANGSMAPQWGVESASGTVDLGAIPATNLAIKNTTKPVGYQFELYIPWKTLLDVEKNTTTKITAGQKIGWFMFANNSNEIGSSNQDNALDPVKRTGPSGNPSVWETTVLEPFQAQPATPAPTAGQ